MCADLIKQNMTILEAERNLPELIMSESDKKKLRHYQDLNKALKELDIEILETFLNEKE